MEIYVLGEDGKTPYLLNEGEYPTTTNNRVALESLK